MTKKELLFAIQSPYILCVICRRKSPLMWENIQACKFISDSLNLFGREEIIGVITK